MRLIPLALLLTTAYGWYNRLAYLRSYADEPADEFLETLKPNLDGSTFLDDSYFLWINTRYEWRKGAEHYKPADDVPNLTPEERVEQLKRLAEEITLSDPLPLGWVIEDEFRRWEQDPDFPTESLGIDDLILNGYRWVDGAELVESETSLDPSASYDEAIPDDSDGASEGPAGNPKTLQDISQFDDPQ